VWDIGLVSSDMIYFAVGKFGLAGGAMVTASHNPGEYNGIKLCREGAGPIGIGTGLADIRDAVAADNFVPAMEQADIEEHDVREDWAAHVLSFVSEDKWPEYKVAIDAGNGMLGAIAPVVTPRTPLQVTEMYYELDGSFPNHPANPIELANLADLQAKIREEKLDFGIAFDGDGDRAVLVDETGELISGTVMTALLAKHFLDKNPGSTILYNAICGRVVPETTEANGGKAIRTKVGHSYIKADMREHDAVFGGEHSSHYYFRDNWSADSGLLAAMIAVDVLAASGKKLSELTSEYRKYVSLEETNFEVDDKAAVIARMKHAFSDGEQDELDGLTVNYTDGWLNVRPSNTEPLLRLNAEAKTKERLDELVDKAKEIISQQ
jgi:phosphomannomutase